jgi:DNA G:T-mismatch repair endonuclease
MPTRLTTEQFIQKAKEVHGDKYDYSKVEYVNNLTKVKIICVKHGEFEQLSHNHINKKSGCPKCSTISKSFKLLLTTEQFIQKAKEVHGDKYDYSQVNCEGQYSYIKIICPEHGEFTTYPRLHISSVYGCPECAQIINTNKLRLTTEQFIQKAKEVHGDKYDYSKVEYVNMTSNVKIICMYHGEFFQTPVNHIHLKSGCLECSYNDKRLTTEQFIQKAKEVHGNKYDYSKVEYVNMKVKVKIICPEHGEFWQNPNAHIVSKAGCIKCVKNDSKPEKELRQFIQSIIPSAVKSHINTVIPRQELDVYIPELKIAFEFQGEYWHKHHHIDVEERDERKRQSCQKLGIRLYEIWENDWKYNRKSVEKRIKQILNMTS